MRIDVQILEVNEIDPRFPDEPHKGLQFGLLVGYTREHQVVDHGIEPQLLRQGDGGDHIFETIAFWTIIRLVVFGSSAAQADSNRVQPGARYLTNSLRPTAIGIEIDRPPVRLCSDLPDAVGYQPVFRQGLSFTTLTKAHDGVLRTVQVPDRKGNHLPLCGLESDPMVRGSAPPVVLKRKTPETRGVASPTDREGNDLPRFYAAVKALAALPKKERDAQLK